MNIVINGQQADVPEGVTLLELIEGRGLDPGVVVAELNLSIVPAEAFAHTRLSAGDSLELLHFVGGG